MPAQCRCLHRFSRATGRVAIRWSHCCGSVSIATARRPCVPSCPSATHSPKEPAPDRAATRTTTSFPAVRLNALTVQGNRILSSFQGGTFVTLRTPHHDGRRTTRRHHVGLPNHQRHTDDRQRPTLDQHPRPQHQSSARGPIRDLDRHLHRLSRRLRYPPPPRLPGATARPTPSTSKPVCVSLPPRTPIRMMSPPRTPSDLYTIRVSLDDEMAAATTNRPP